MSLATIGTAAGLIGALALRRVLQSLLFEVNATDPLTLTAGTLLLMAAALLACWLPARHATKVDPIEALRCE